MTRPDHAYYVIRLSTGKHEAVRADELLPSDQIVAGYDCIDDARRQADASDALEREVRAEIERRQIRLFDA